MHVCMCGCVNVCVCVYLCVCARACVCLSLSLSLSLPPFFLSPFVSVWQHSSSPSASLHFAAAHGQRKNATCNRRYSDFEPLDAVLRKRFPFRIIPQ